MNNKQNEKSGFKIGIDDKGKKIVLINDKLFVRRRLSNNEKYTIVRGIVEKMLLSLEGEYVIVKENNKKIFFDEIFADEYTHSLDSMQKNVPRRNAKMNLIKAMKIIISMASYINHQQNKKTIRKVDAKRGFDYYKIRFGILNGNGSYTIYEGILNVRLASDGKGYAYDITKISVDYGTQVNGKKPLSTDELSL